MSRDDLGGGPRPLPRVDAVFLDCDGVLTTGTYLYGPDGKAYKAFGSVDSKAISAARRAGVYLAVISEDPSGREINRARCRDMGVDFFAARDPADKLTIVERICAERSLSLDRCAFVGDDVGDAVAMAAVGVAIAVGNAQPVVKRLARRGYVTRATGGHGAVREALEWVLRVQVG